MGNSDIKTGEIRYGFALLTEANTGEICAIKIDDVSLILRVPAYKTQAEIAETSNKRDPYKNVGAVVYLPHTSVRVRETVLQCIALLAADPMEGEGR